MQFKPDPRWRGITRHTLLINIITLLLSITVLIMGSILTKQLNNARLHEPSNGNNKFSFDQSQSAFFNTLTPLLSTLFSTAETLRHMHTSARPKTSLLMSLLIFLGWTINFSFWTNCDVGDGNRLGFCEEWPRLAGNGTLTSPLQYARFVVALCAMMVYGVLVGFAGMAFWKRGEWVGGKKGGMGVESKV